MQNHQQPLPPLNWLKTFATAARLLNFTAAAKELNMTQSAVSQQIRLLEENLGQPLFIRDHKKLSLSNSGMAYLPSVQEALQLVQRATHDIFSPLKYGVLNLQVNIAFLMLWLAPRLPEFTKQYPGVTLRLSSTNWNTESIGLSADLTIGHGKGHWPNMHSECLITPKLRPFCSPRLASQLHSIDDLQQLPLIDILGNHQQWEDWFKVTNLNAAPRIPVSHQVDTAAAAVALAVNDGGVLLSYDELLADDLARGQLVAPFDVYVDTVDSYFLIYNKERPLSKAAELFKDWLKTIKPKQNQ